MKVCVQLPIRIIFRSSKDAGGECEIYLKSVKIWHLCLVEDRTIVAKK